MVYGDMRPVVIPAHGIAGLDAAGICGCLFAHLALFYARHL